MDKTGVICQIKAEMLESLDNLLAMIENGEPIDCAETLRQTELKIVAATDKIAGKCIEAVVTNALNDECVINESKIIVKASPTRVKNHGKRDVVIQPYRGDPFTIKAAYHCRAGVSPNKGLKKGALS